MPPRDGKRSKRKRASNKRRAVWAVVVAAAAGLVVAGVSFAACSGWDAHHPFDHDAPEVDRALADLDAGRLESAEEALEKYLGTGACSDAGIGLPDSVREKPNGSFDLGLVLFFVAEKFGQRFGDEEANADAPNAAELLGRRSAEVDCALVAVKAIAADVKVPIDLRARAYYLAGNLEFLRKHYEEAVKMYDEALRLVPGMPEDAGGDEVGRDAAYNRAIALRRIQDKDGGQDGGDDGSSGQDGAADAGPQSGDGGGDKGQDGGPDGGDDGGKNDDRGDAGKDGGSDPNSGQDGGAGQDASAPPPEPQPANPDQRQDDRMLDRLEEAPMYQEQEAKQRGQLRRGRVLEDK